MCESSWLCCSDVILCQFAVSKFFLRHFLFCTVVESPWGERLADRSVHSTTVHSCLFGFKSLTRNQETTTQTTTCTALMHGGTTHAHTKAIRVMCRVSTRLSFLCGMCVFVCVCVCVCACSSLSWSAEWWRLRTCCVCVSSAHTSLQTLNTIPQGRLNRCKDVAARTSRLTHELSVQGPTKKLITEVTDS